MVNMVRYCMSVLYFPKPKGRENCSTQMQYLTILTTNPDKERFSIHLFVTYTHVV